MRRAKARQQLKIPFNWVPPAKQGALMKSSLQLGKTPYPIQQNEEEKAAKIETQNIGQN